MSLGKSSAGLRQRKAQEVNQDKVAPRSSNTWPLDLSGSLHLQKAKEENLRNKGTKADPGTGLVFSSQH